jgi:hypothetical protein
MHYCAACCVFGVPQVFRRLDEDLDGVLSRGELNQFQVHTEGMEISEEVWRWLARTFDSDANGITCDGFVVRWLERRTGLLASDLLPKLSDSCPIARHRKV